MFKDTSISIQRKNNILKPTFEIAIDYAAIAAKQIDNITDINVKTVFNNIKNSLNNKKGNFDNIQIKLGDIADKFEYTDSETKQQALNLLNKVSENEGTNIKNLLNDTEELLDVVNTSNNKYLEIGTRQSELYKKAKAYFKFKNQIQNESDLHKIMEQELKYEKLKKFIVKHENYSPEISKKLYEKCYLPTLNNETKSVCKKISDEFGTKLFLTKNSNDKNTAQYIHDEFLQWQIASERKAKFPPYIDLSDKTSEKAIKNEIGGQFSLDKHIDITEKKQLVHGLRHEMVHLNDEDIFYHAIEPYRRFETDLINAGISNRSIKHAFSGIRELKAVAMGTLKAGKDYSIYSPEFKKCLIELGIPEWMFNIKPKAELKKEIIYLSDAKHVPSDKPREQQKKFSLSRTLTHIKNAVVSHLIN